MTVPMTVPACQAQACEGVADDGTGLCAAHRRALTMTTVFQDSVRAFLLGNHLPQSAIRPTTENAAKCEEAGKLLAQGLALLVSTQLDDVSFDPSPIYRAVDEFAYGTNHAPWRVSFSWRSGEPIELEDDDNDEDDEDELGTEIDYDDATLH